MLAVFPYHQRHGIEGFEVAVACFPFGSIRRFHFRGVPSWISNIQVRPQSGVVRIVVASPVSYIQLLRVIGAIIPVINMGLP